MSDFSKYERSYIECYNRKGELITSKEVEELLTNDAYRVVKQEVVGDLLVSTVWICFDHNFQRHFDDKAPIHIFETMVFTEEGYIGQYMERYSTEHEALKGHENAVKWAKKNQTIEVNDDNRRR